MSQLAPDFLPAEAVSLRLELFASEQLRKDQKAHWLGVVEALKRERDDALRHAHVLAVTLKRTKEFVGGSGPFPVPTPASVLSAFRRDYRFVAPPKETDKEGEERT